MAMSFDDLPDEAATPVPKVQAKRLSAGLSFDDLPDEAPAAVPNAAPELGGIAGYMSRFNPGELYRGAARSVDNMGLAAARVLGIPAAQAFDAAHGLVTDDAPNMAQNALSQHVLNPLQQRADSLAPAADASMADKVMHGVGGLGGNMLAMLATGGLSRAPAMAEAATTTLPRVAGEVAQAARTMAVPAATDAINTGHDIEAQTGSLPQALGGAAAAGAANIGMGLLPAALPGNLAMRVATGAPVGAATGEVTRHLRNLAMPEGMQQPFDPSNLAVDALTGSVLAGAMGRNPEARASVVDRMTSLQQDAINRTDPAALQDPAAQLPAAQPEAQQSMPIETPAPPPIAPKVLFAGSSNVRPLFESMGMDQSQMDSSLSLLADDVPDIEAARRGAISWEETGRLAALTGTTVDSLRKHRAGVAFNAEEQVAATRLLKDQTVKTLGLGAKISSGSASEIEQANFLQSLNDLRTTQKAVMASRAEIGRALSVMRADVTTMKQASHLLDGVGGAQGAKAIADALTNAARVGGVEAANKLARQAGSDGFWTAYKSLLLSSPDTHAVNIISNLATSLMQVPTRAVAGGIGAAKRLIGLNGETRLGESIYQLGGMLEGAVNGARGAVDSWRTGEDAFGGENKAEVYRTDYPGQKVWGVPLRLLQSEDQFFKYLNDGMARYSGAYRMAASEVKGQGPLAVNKRAREILADPPKELIEAGEDAALFHTFNNQAGKITQAVNNLRHSLPYGTGNLVVPFLKTPANLITYAAKHSPAAPIFKQVRQDLRAGGHVQEEALARMGIGSLLMSFGAIGQMGGWLNGGGPSDEEKRKAWLAAGNRPYTIRVNDEWYDYSRIEPLATLVGISADIASGVEDQALGFASIMKAIGRNFTSKTWLQGLSGVMQAMSDPDRYGDAWVNRTAATLAQPATILSHVGRYMDPYQRETDRASFVDQLKYRLPGLRESLPQKLDVYGEPIMEADRQIGRAGPFPLSTPSDDLVRKEASRLGWAPSKQQDSFTSGKQKHVLTAEQVHERDQITGQLIHRDATALMRSKAWQAMDDDQRRQALDKVVTKARNAVKVALIPYVVNGKRGPLDRLKSSIQQSEARR